MENEGYRSVHAKVRAQQRGIPPLIDRWLDEFGEEDYDGRGGVRIFFSRRSAKAMERTLGRAPVRRMTEYLRVYKVESSHDGQVITVGHRTGRIWRR
ncbi:MAG: hypothetical protein IPH55_06585 [Betaproteobacteria bacterium]|nr:hypothetical protein [Betaproteobacteria bacterium]